MSNAISMWWCNITGMTTLLPCRSDNISGWNIFYHTWEKVWSTVRRFSTSICHSAWSRPPCPGTTWFDRKSRTTNCTIKQWSIDTARVTSRLFSRDLDWHDEWQLTVRSKRPLWGDRCRWGSRWWQHTTDDSVIRTTRNLDPRIITTEERTIDQRVYAKDIPSLLDGWINIHWDKHVCNLLHSNLLLSIDNTYDLKAHVDW